MKRCNCEIRHDLRRIVLTGGPGAGKTAVLELIRQAFCSHVHVLPEAAGIVFGGGFPRDQSSGAQKAAQRAIFYVQRELEHSVDDQNAAIVLCDRGTVDGAAYWAGGVEDFCASVQLPLADQLARYHAVIHLRTPSAGHGYNHRNPLRRESAEEAAAIDDRIASLWQGHPRLFDIESSPDFLTKATRAIAILGGELPECCRLQWRVDWPPRFSNQHERQGNQDQQRD